MAKATDLSRQRNVYQGVLMGIDLGHGVQMRAGPARFPLVVPDAGSSRSRGAQQWKQPAKKKYQESKGQVK